MERQSSGFMDRVNASMQPAPGGQYSQVGQLLQKMPDAGIFGMLRPLAEYMAGKSGIDLYGQQQGPANPLINMQQQPGLLGGLAQLGQQMQPPAQRNTPMFNPAFRSLPGLLRR